MNKSLEVVITSTNKPSMVYKDDTGGFGFYNKAKTYTKPERGRFFYVISDDPIKFGDVYILMPELEIRRAETDLPINRDWKKVVASTNEDLTHGQHFNKPLPKLSRTLISDIVKALNDGASTIYLNVKFKGPLYQFNGIQISTMFEELRNGKVVYSAYDINNCLVAKSMPEYMFDKIFTPEIDRSYQICASIYKESWSRKEHINDIIRLIELYDRTGPVSDIETWVKNNV